MVDVRTRHQLRDAFVERDIDKFKQIYHNYRRKFANKNTFDNCIDEIRDLTKLDKITCEFLEFIVTHSFRYHDFDIISCTAIKYNNFTLFKIAVDSCSKIDRLKNKLTSSVACLAVAAPNVNYIQYLDENKLIHRYDEMIRSILQRSVNHHLLEHMVQKYVEENKSATIAFLSITCCHVDENLSKLMIRYGDTSFMEGLYIACFYGNINNVKLMLSHIKMGTYSKSEFISTLAASLKASLGNGYFKTAKILLREGAAINKDIVLNVVMRGNIHMIRYIHSIAPSGISYNISFKEACRRGYLNIAVYLSDKIDKNVTLLTNYLRFAVASGNIKLVEFLVELGATNISAPCILGSACSGNNLNMVKFIIERVDKRNINDCLNVHFLINDADILQTLFDHGVDDYDSILRRIYKYSDSPDGNVSQLYAMVLKRNKEYPHPPGSRKNINLTDILERTVISDKTLDHERMLIMHGADPRNCDISRRDYVKMLNDGLDPELVKDRVVKIIRKRNHDINIIRKALLRYTSLSSDAISCITKFVNYS